MSSNTWIIFINSVPLMPGGPIECTFSMRTKNTLHLKWERPVNCHLDYYEVTCIEHGQGNTSNENTTYPEKATCILDGLKPGALYDIGIKTCSYGEKSKAITDSFQTSK